MTNDFAEHLAYSHKQENEPWWEHVYRRAGDAEATHDAYCETHYPRKEHQ